MDQSIRKLKTVLGEEFDRLHLRLLLVKIILAFLPHNFAGRLRARILRLAGFDIHKGVILLDLPTIVGSGRIDRRLSIGASTFVNADCFFDLAAGITIGKHVSFGPGVMLITGAHQIGPSARRAGNVTPMPIRVGDGAWLGARCIVLPGISIGAGAIVAAGAVVTKDVEPDTIVGGVPAVVIRSLS